MASPAGGAPDSEQLRRLQLVTDAALAHLDLDELLHALLTRTRDALETDTATILLLDDAGAELHARAAVGIEEEVERKARVPVGAGFAGRVVAERRPRIVPDVDRADVWNPLLRERGLKSLVGVPLIVEGRAFGVLHVGSLTPRAFGQRDVQLLQLVADRAALAIDHARVFAAEREARLRLERIQSVTDAALAHLGVDELLAELLVRIRDGLGTDTCAVLLLDEDGDELEARAALGIEEEVERGVRIPVGQGFAGRVAAERRPVVLADVGAGDVVNPILLEKGIKSLLGVPLVVRDRVIGVVHVGSLTPRDFGERDVELLQLVGDRVALAVERARVHEALADLDALRVNFVAIASHELRTPAAAVYGTLKTILERGDALPPEIVLEVLHAGVGQAERLNRLLEQLLDLSRLDARTISVTRRRVRVRELLAEALVASLPPDAPAPVRLHADVELAADVDPHVLERVVVNLLTNALRYGAGPVELRAQRTDGELRVSVHDAGSGVPEELRDRLFERFSRGGEAGGGTGLGLAIAQAYAQAHGGEVVYHHADPGAHFELVVPLEGE